MDTTNHIPENFKLLSSNVETQFNYAINKQDNKICSSFGNTNDWKLIDFDYEAMDFTNKIISGEKSESANDYQTFISILKESDNVYQTKLLSEWFHSMKKAKKFYNIYN